MCHIAGTLLRCFDRLKFAEWIGPIVGHVQIANFAELSLVRWREKVGLEPPNFERQPLQKRASVCSKYSSHYPNRAVQYGNLKNNPAALTTFIHFRCLYSNLLHMCCMCVCVYVDSGY